MFSRYAGKQKIKRHGAIIALLLAERFADSDSAENRAAADQRALSFRPFALFIHARCTIFFSDTWEGGGGAEKGEKRETTCRGGEGERRERGESPHLCKNNFISTGTREPFRDKLDRYVAVLWDGEGGGKDPRGAR